jgi:hypothetical protein
MIKALVLTIGEIGCACPKTCGHISPALRRKASSKRGREAGLLQHNASLHFYHNPVIELAFQQVVRTCR